MLVPSSWLRQVVSVEADDNNLAEALTLAGLEVEAIEPAYPWLLKAKVVRISRVEWIDKAKNISLCTVETGEEEIQVVCGAPNVSEGMLSAFVPPGTLMPDGKEVKKATVYGKASEGMLASEYELLLEGDASGIFDISSRYPDARIGQNLSALTGVSDTVFEIGITPNRPDCLSILGVAREAAAIFKAKMNEVEPSLDGSVGLQDVDIKIEEPSLCTRYVGAKITGVNVAPSPGWLARRLVASGVRPINNIVDITNYVLLELGQPLHAFDLDTLSGPAIFVRKAQRGEKIVTLDSKERELSEEMLLICDKKGPVAIAGVMGGQDTQVTEKTSNILIESAWFSPSSIRRTAKRLKLPTEASYRFERGVDPCIQEKAALRACELVLEMGGGTFGGIKDVNPVPYSPVTVRYRPSRMRSLIGARISSDTMQDILVTLGCKVEKEKEDAFLATPPSYRGDLKAEEDILEEIARCYGFSKIPTSSPVATLIVERPTSFRPFLRKVRSILSSQGLSEIISYSFISPSELKALGFSKDDDRNRAVRLKNPLAEDQSIMRTSLVPCMLSTISRNLRRRNMSLSLFEVGAVFIDKGPGVIPDEYQRCCVALTGRRFPNTWAWSERESDFFDLKGIAENLLATLNCQNPDFRLPQKTESYLEDGTQIDIVCSQNHLGVMGQLDISVSKSFDISQKVFILDLDLAALSKASSSKKVFRPLSRFPSVERDLSVIVDDSTRAIDILDFIEEKGSDALVSYYIFDVYRGKQIPKGKKALGIHFVYRAKDRTLSEQEVEEMHEPLQKAILTEFRGSLRS